jgi:hypothetical protein
MADQGVAVNGKVYGFEELRAVGGMTAPQIASLYR